MLAVISIYFFIVIGFIAKKIFSELNQKSFVIISVYFLQPFLTLWGLTVNYPIAKDDLASSFIISYLT